MNTANLRNTAAIITLLAAAALHGCGGGGTDGSEPFTAGYPPGYPDTVGPIVSDTSPSNAEISVPLNSSISVTFSERMNNGTVNAATFNLKTTTGGIPVNGTVAMDSNAGTLTPSASLAPNTQYTATVTTDVKDFAGNSLENVYSWNFTTGTSLDTTAPTVTAVAPINNSIGIATNTSVSATFSEAMTNATLTTANFSVQADIAGTTVAGTTAVNGNTVTFRPSARLSPAVRYRATVSTGATDAAGNPLAANYVWRFTTAAAPDVTPPVVSVISPNDGATDVAINSTISATFSEAMTNSTLTNVTFNLKQASGGAVGGTVTIIDRTARFVPAANLLGSTAYTATITTGVKDAAGNALRSDFVWDFTTAAIPDTTPPTVVSNAPANGASGIALGASISVTFSELMSNSTLNSANFTLGPSGGGPLATGTVTVNDRTATFTPASDLAPNTQYTAAISTAAKDAAGNSLAAIFSWTFTSGAPVVTPNTAALDWDVVNHPSLAGYRVYYGTSPRTYIQTLGTGIDAGTVPNYTVTGLTTGLRYYFAVTAFDSSGNESGYSNEVVKDIP